MNKKVSIVIPIYNMEKRLERCLDSILNQTYTNYEAILINDGSDDRSGEICDYYSNNDSRFVVSHCENRGVSTARNKGIDIASGDYLIFVDSDDTIKNNMLEEMVNALEKSNSDVLISGITFVENNKVLKEIFPECGGEIGLDIWEYVCKNETGLYGYVSNKLYKMNLIKSNNIYFNELRKIQEDLEFALNVYSKTKAFYLLKKSYYLYEYSVSNRQPDTLGYMEIEMKKKNILKKLNIFEKYEKYHTEKISNMIFTFLYWLPKENSIFSAEVNKLYRLDNLDESLNLFYIKGLEKKIITFLLKNHMIKLLKVYFIVRSNIRKLAFKSKVSTL